MANKAAIFCNPACNFLHNRCKAFLLRILVSSRPPARSGAYNSTLVNVGIQFNYTAPAALCLFFVMVPSMLMVTGAVGICAFSFMVVLMMVFMMVLMMMLMATATDTVMVMMMVFLMCH